MNFSVAGTAILFGWDGVEIEGLMYNNAGTPVMALGIVIRKIRLDEIIDKMFKKKLAGVTWLTELTVGKLYVKNMVSFIDIEYQTANIRPTFDCLFNMTT